MAPALTEPLSPNNTLSASTSSVSPRPTISNTTANNLLKTTNHIIRNGNTNNNKNISNSINYTTATTSDALLNEPNKNINVSQKNFGIIEKNGTHFNNNNIQKNNLFRRSLTSACAFQSAFEESIKKSGIVLQPDQQPPKNKKHKKNSPNSPTIHSVIVKENKKDELQSNSPKENINKPAVQNILKTYPITGSKENLSNNFFKKVKTEPLYNQTLNNSKISSKNSNICNNSSNSNNKTLDNIDKLTNGPSSLLSTSSIVCKAFEAKAISATTPTRSNKTNKLMGPIVNTTQKHSQDFIIISKDKKSVEQQQSKNKNIFQGFVPIDKDFEEAINKINNVNKQSISKEDIRQKQNEIGTLLKIEDLQQMDLSNRKDNNENIVNISDKSIVLRSNIESVTDSSFIINKRIGGIVIDDTCGNIIISGCGDNFVKDVEDSVIIECDSRNQPSDIEFSQQEIRSTGTTDTTVSASEGENNFLEDNFQDATQTMCHSQQSAPNKLNSRSPPKTPISSSQPLSQIIGTPTSNILTPQSISLNSSTMGLQKDFKEAEMDDQVISDMDLLQVLKGLDATTAGDNLCDLAGNLGLFNDVDVMNYEEIAVPNSKESDATLDTRGGIEKCQQQIERQCEYLLRRLRKLQSRYMLKHVSEEICGLFEWTNRLVRRKDQHEQIPSLIYEEDKHRPVSATAMRTILRKIDSVAKAQHSNASDTSLQSLKKYKCSRSISSSLINSNLLGRDHHDKKGSSNTNTSNIFATVIKSFDEKTTEEIGYVSGLLHSEMRQTQNSFDSDATASSSGGESADEMVTYNNQSQQSLSISKRAGWKWARDRSAIASRWTWLCAQISDLEYRIRQHNELYQQIRKNKGVVQLEVAAAKYAINKKQKFDSIINVSIEKTLKMDRSDNGNIALNSDNVTNNSTNNVNGYRGVLSGGVNNPIENKNSNNSNFNVNYNDSSNNKINENNNNANNNICNNNCKQNIVHQIDESGNTSTITEGEDNDDNTLGACRTRPFQRSGFRKRKLLQTANVHTVSKKAARPSFRCSTIKCGCQWPFNPCALCTGRPDPTAPRDLPDTMMPSERIALLDPGFHSVLSFSEDVPTSIHIEAIFHMPEWQNKLMRSISKNSKSFGRKSEDHPHGNHGRGSGDISSKRSYNKSNPKYRKDSSTTPSTNRIKKNRKNLDYPSGFSHLSGTVQSPQNSSNLSIKNKNRKPSSGTMMMSSSSPPSSTIFAPNNLGASGSKANSNFSMINSNTTSSINGFQSVFAESLLSSFQCDNLDGSSNGVLPRSKNASPTPVSGGNQKYERFLERKNRNSYDIDNIVIPYSVAASTRVEILPYKEIPTPKWRIIDDDIKEVHKETIEIINDSENDLDKNSSDIDIQLSNQFVSKNNNDLKLSCDSENYQNNNVLELQDDLNQDDFPFHLNDIAEDISTEAIQSRHERALLEERKKFSTYLKFPWSTRSRANRRIDSRAESSGANTPDPTSPAPHTPSAGGDQESIPSPVAPSTPLAIQGESGDGDLLNTTFGHRRERKRTVSSKKEKDIYYGIASLERRSQSPDFKEVILPYEPLHFPISDDMFQKMLQLMPNINDSDDNSNLISSIGGSNNNHMDSSNIENINRINDSRKNSVSLNLSDTFNDNNNSSVFVSSTSTDINEFYSNIDSNRNNLNENTVNNSSNKTINIKKSTLKMGSSSFHEYFDSNGKRFLLSDESDTDSAETGLDEDPNDPEWKEPE